MFKVYQSGAAHMEVDWQRCQWTWPCVFIVNFEDVQYINLQKRDQDSWKSRIEHFSGIVNAALRLLAIVHYCWKVLHLKCLPGSWPCLWFVVFFVELWTNRSSRSEMFFEIGVLKNSALFTGKHLCWSLFLMNLWAFMSVTLWKRDFNTGVFYWILRNF